MLKQLGCSRPQTPTQLSLLFHCCTSTSSPSGLSLLHLQMVQLAGLRAGHEPRPVHRDAHQRARRVERAAAFLELQRRALALRDGVGSRRIERAAVALALLEELQVVCECEDVSWGML